VQPAFPGPADYRVEAQVEQLGGPQPGQLARLATDAGVLLVELRRSDGTGLEDLFFSLTRAADAATISKELA
jgi:hypothetical protein